MTSKISFSFSLVKADGKGEKSRQGDDRGVQTPLKEKKEKKKMREIRTACVNRSLYTW